jgi:hypothetical protein
MAGEYVGGAAGVRTGYDRDVLVGELDAGVGGGDFRIIPFFNRAHEDSHIHLARQLQLIDASKVVGQHNFAGGHRQQHDALLDLGDIRIFMAASLAAKSTVLLIKS